MSPEADRKVIVLRRRDEAFMAGRVVGTLLRDALVGGGSLVARGVGEIGYRIADEARYQGAGVIVELDELAKRTGRFMRGVSDGLRSRAWEDKRD